MARKGGKGNRGAWWPEALALHDQGESYAALAQKYGVTLQAVRNAVLKLKEEARSEQLKRFHKVMSGESEWDYQPEKSAIDELNEQKEADRRAVEAALQSGAKNVAEISAATGITWPRVHSILFDIKRERRAIDGE